MKSKKHESFTPVLNLIPDILVDQIIDQAVSILEKTGVFIENMDSFPHLADIGARCDRHSGRIYFSRKQIEGALQTAPSKIELFDRDLNQAIRMENNNVHYDPGSAAIKIYDNTSHSLKKPDTGHYIRLIKLTHGLENMDAQSTAMVPSDVPESFADRYRLYLSLLYSSKPVITGIFAEDGLLVMKELLTIVRDGADNLKKYPLAIFDACPSPPLKWSRLTLHSLIECARSWIPTELVSMPLAGATAPVTLAEALVQHTAENLSGVTICQMIQPGAPIIYGGSPSIFDMRYGTTPMGAIETIMIDCAYAAIGKKLGLPTHAYLGLSDAKSPDFQAGMESATGIMLGTLSGINMISGPGMLDFESTQCEEKLVLDNETCGNARRLLKGIQIRDTLQAEQLLMNIDPEFQFLSHPHTLKWFREEHRFPSQVIDRQDAGSWEKQGSKTARVRAQEQARKLVDEYDCPPLAEEKQRALNDVILKDAAKHGITTLPDNGFTHP